MTCHVAPNVIRLTLYLPPNNCKNNQCGLVQATLNQMFSVLSICFVSPSCSWRMWKAMSQSQKHEFSWYHEIWYFSYSTFLLWFHNKHGSGVNSDRCNRMNIPSGSRELWTLEACRQPTNSKLEPIPSCPNVWSALLIGDLYWAIESWPWPSLDTSVLGSSNR